MRLNETNLNLGLTIFFFLFLEPGYTEPISFAYNSTTFKCFCWHSTRHDSLSTSHKKKIYVSRKAISKTLFNEEIKSVTMNVPNKTEIYWSCRGCFE